MNKVILLGRSTKDPEIRVTQNNAKVAKFTLAVNRKYVKEGEERQADFFTILAFSKLGEFAEKYLKTGLQINVCGRLQTRVWTDDDGEKHYVTEVIAEEIYFADSIRKTEPSVRDLCAGTTDNQNKQDEERITPDDDDLPF